jgi:hypothetical protein
VWELRIGSGIGLKAFESLILFEKNAIAMMDRG